MQRDGIIYHGRNTGFVQGRLQGRTIHCLIQPHRILVEDMRGIGGACRRLQQGATGQDAVVKAGGTAARGVVIVQMRQLDVQDGGLQGVQTRIATDFIMPVTDFHAMVYDLPQLFGQTVVLREERAAVAVAAQVLGWEERRAADFAHRAGLATAAVRKNIVGANGLAGIFNYIQAVPVRDVENLPHRRALPEQMDGHDGFGARRNRAFDGRGVQVERIGRYINEYERQPQQRDDFGRGGEREIGRDDFIAGL